jgi:prolyl-tRNA editing enzyme YbaK/EbsC (Cys-tRNA(Pro) deacylase)
VIAIESDLVGLPRVRAALQSQNLDLRIITPGAPMPTVALAASAVGCSHDQIIKTVVFTSPDGRAVIAVANGMHRVDRRRLAVMAGVDALKLAGPEFVLERTGYPAGGVSPIGIRDSEAPMVIDTAVLEQGIVFAGAGTDTDLLELGTDLLVALTGARIAEITQRD